MRDAVDYAARLYKPGDRVAVVVIPRDGVPPKTLQRVLPFESLTGEKVQRWLRYNNARKADIYLGMNPIKDGTWRRLKSDVAEVRRVYLDVDDNGPAVLKAIARDVERGETPRPAHVVTSSPGRYQVVWNVSGRPAAAAAEDVMRRLAVKYCADPAAVDVSRVLRWPGYRSHKRNGHLVTVRNVAEAKPVELAAFRALPEIDARAVADRSERIRPAGGRTQSEVDWAEVNRKLAKGEDPAVIRSELERTRADKPNPAYYASRTVARAQELRGSGRGR